MLEHELQTLLHEAETFLPAGFRVEQTKIVKNNGVKETALFLMPDDGGPGASALVFPGPYLLALKSGDDLALTAKKLADHLLSPLPKDRYLSSLTAILTDYKEVKPRLAFRLLSQKLNTEIGEELVFRPYLDLFLIYMVVFESDNGTESSARVTKALMERWGVTEEDLYRDAMENTRVHRGIFIKPLEEMVQGTDTPASDILVLSNPDGYYGASLLAVTDIFRALAEEFKTDLWVVPSSVHELLLVPDNGFVLPEYLRHIIDEVNRLLRPEDVLSDHPYFFSRERDELLPV